ncbi:MAG: HAMP domain-containing histidine kinase [Lentisphaeraceae bacterium]|nr:HAMP domain-containing histidine kinase [Lentisphaeraceae bacterium]
MDSLKVSMVKKILQEFSEITPNYLFAAIHGQIVYINTKLEKFLSVESDLPKVKDILSKNEDGYQLHNARRTIPVDVKHRIITIDEEKVSLYICHDLSQVLKLQKTMQQRCNEYEVFSYRVAHDLKGPLSAAKQYLSMVEQNEIDSAMVVETLEKSIGIIQSLYVLSGLSQNTDFQEVDLGSIIPSLEDMMPDFPDYTLSCLHTFYGSPTITLTLLQNLFKNTIDHFKGKGTPEVKITTEERNDEKVIVKFEDNGSGIPFDERDSIQEAFYKGKESDGLGLGMNIVKKAVELQDGKMKISDSEELGGVCIELTFPAKDPDEIF